MLKKLKFLMFISVDILNGFFICVPLETTPHTYLLGDVATHNDLGYPGEHLPTQSICLSPFNFDHTA